MNLDTRHWVLLVIGLLAALKSAWMLISPASFRRMAAWWAKCIVQVNTLAAWVCFALAVALWVLVLANQDLADWLLVIIGLGAAVGGLFYLRRDGIEPLVGRVVTSRGNLALRGMAVIGLALSLFILWVALRGTAA